MPFGDRFDGVVGRTLDESTPWWPDCRAAPEGAPNVVMVLLDDVGYAQFGCYGSDIATPTFDRLAAGGLRYSNFHTTALCSPTRACLLTGPQPPHQRHGPHRRVRRRASPATTRRSRTTTASSPRSSVRNGYATFAVGKWHLAPATEMTMGSPRDTLAARAAASSGSTASWAARPTSTTPTSCTTTTRSTRRARPRRATTSPRTWPTRPSCTSRTSAAVAPDKPFFLWFTPGACHAPHQAPARVHRAATAAGSTRAGTRGATRCSPASSRRACCPPGTRLQRAAAAGSRRGTR